MSETFPEGRIPCRVEFAFGAEPEGDPATWVWTDVSAWLLDQTISIRRGRPNEGAQLSPSTMSFVLDNPDGRFTPGLPTGAYWPNVRRGVPCRIWAPADAVTMSAGDPAPGGATGARTASAAGFNTGTLDLRIECALDRVPAQFGAVPPPGFDFVPWEETYQELAGRWETGARIWRLMLNPQGAPYFDWSSDGTSIAAGATGTEPVPYAAGRRFALRVLFNRADPDRAGVWSVQYATAPTLEGPWKPLGAPVTGSASTTVLSAATQLEIADIANQTLYPAGTGRYYRLRMADSSTGAMLASPDFTALTPGQTSFNDAQGNAWTVRTGAQVTSLMRRMVGHTDSWAPSWPWGDLSQEAPDTPHPGESRCAVTVSGVLRRMTQGAPTIPSPLRRYIPLGTPTPVAYWPLEDGEFTTRAASGLDGGVPLVVSGLQFGRASGLPGSALLPLSSNGATLRAPVSFGPTLYNEWTVSCLYQLSQMPNPSGGSWASVLTVQGAGAPWQRFTIRLNATNLQVLGTEDVPGSTASAVLLDAEVASRGFAGGWRRLHLKMWRDAPTSTTNVNVVWHNYQTRRSETLFGSYLGEPGNLRLVDTTMGIDGMGIGHLSIYRTSQVPESMAADSGFNGEDALTRIRRVARETGTSISATGLASRAAAMGPQPIADRWTIFQDCAAVDGGILAERRDSPGLQYIARDLLYGQQPAATLDAGRSEIANPLAPVLDDQRIRNDVTVKRTFGSYARAVDAESIRLEGRYETSLTLNCASDGQLPGLAAHRLALGLGDTMRYAALTGEMMTAGAAVPEWLGLDSGARIKLDRLPPQHPVNTVDLMAEGYTETLSPVGWQITANCSPYKAWDAAETPSDARAPVAPDAPVRVDGDYSTLDAVVTAAATRIPVATLRPGQEWTEAGPPLNPNPYFGTDTAGWTGTGAALARVARPAPLDASPGDWCLRLTPNGTAAAPQAATARFVVAPGTVYHGAAWLRCGRTRTGTVQLQWFDAGGAALPVTTADTSLRAGEWVWATASAAAPATAATCALALVVTGTPPASDVVWAADAILRAAPPGTSPADFPFDVRVEGEIMRVRGIEHPLRDSFNRPTVTGGWGRTPDGNVWGIFTGTAANLSTNGRAGLIRPTPAGTVHAPYVPSLTYTGNVRAKIVVSTNQVSTGGDSFAGILLRSGPLSDYYRVRWEFRVGGQIGVSVMQGSTQLISQSYFGSYVPGERFHLEAMVQDGLLWAMYWRESDPNGGISWDLTVAPNPPGLASGSVGCFASALAANTNVGLEFSFDEFSINGPQTFIVDRGAAGTTAAAHARKAPVHIANPALVTL